MINKYLLSISSTILIGAVVGTLSKCTTMNSRQITKCSVESYLDLPEGFTPDLVVYYLYESSSALPMGIHMHTHDKSSILFSERDSFVMDYLPGHVFLSNGSKIPSPSGGPFHKRAEQDLLFRLLFAKIYEGKNILIVTDAFHHIWTNLSKYSVDLSKISVILLENGTLVYKNAKSINPYFFLSSLSSFFQLMLTRPSVRPILLPILSQNTLGRRDELGFPFHSIIAWYSHPETIYSYHPTDILTKEEFMQGIRKLNVWDYWNTLSDGQKESTTKMLMFDPKFFKKIEESSKKVVLFIDSYFKDSYLHNSYIHERHQYIKRIKEKFGSNFLYLVKQHPCDKAKSLYNNLDNILVCPEKMPVEIILMKYKDKIHAVIGKDTSPFLYVPDGIESWMIHKPTVEPFTTWQESGYKVFFILD